MTATQLIIPGTKISEIDMQRAFYSAHSQRYELVANNLYLGWCGGEMDIFGLRKSGFCDEIEIKLSASDFKADFKKTVVVSCEPYTPENTFTPCKNEYCYRCKGTGTVEQSDSHAKAGDKCGWWTNYGERNSIRMDKHEALSTGHYSCNYFSFYLPEELVEKCQIPDYAGLYVFNTNFGQWNSRHIKEIKKPKRLHSRKISDYNKYHTAKKMHFRYWDMVMREHS